MEITSGRIKPEQIWQEAEEIAALFKRLGDEKLTVFYGFGCDREPEELYQHIEIKTDDLLGFLSRSMAEEIYHLGEDDFFIQNTSLEVQFLLCHESDVHLETENGEIAAHMKARWTAKKYEGYEKLSDSWVPILDTQATD